MNVAKDTDTPVSFFMFVAFGLHLHHSNCYDMNLELCNSIIQRPIRDIVIMQI